MRVFSETGRVVCRNIIKLCIVASRWTISDIVHSYLALINYSLPVGKNCTGNRREWQDLFSGAPVPYSSRALSCVSWCRQLPNCGGNKCRNMQHSRRHIYCFSCKLHTVRMLLVDTTTDTRVNCAKLDLFK